MSKLTVYSLNKHCTCGYYFHILVKAYKSKSQAHTDNNYCVKKLIHNHLC